MHSSHKRGVRLLVVGLIVMMIGAFFTASPVSAKDKKNKQIEYSFTFVNGTTISGTATGNTVFLANAGGNDLNPVGMTVHVSCSDKFEGGFGQKDGPDSVLDSAWRIDSFSISKDGGKKTCGEAFTPPPPPTPPASPEIDIIKTVNGDDANNAPGITVEVGDTVTLAYKVTNTGDVKLTDIVVTDLDLGVIGCPRSSLVAGQSMQCSEATMDVTAPGHVFMKARVDANATTLGPLVAPTPAGKDRGYVFNFVNGVSISGTSTSNVTFLPDAGGASVNNPTGMDIHVSCSDKFVGGFGQKDGPTAGVDTAWQIASFAINGKKSCGDTFAEVTTSVMAMDPINYTANDPEPPVTPPLECTLRVIGANNVKVSWDAVDGATTYAIKRNSTWLARTTGLMFTDTNAPRGVELEYFVRSIGPDGRSDYVSCGSVKLPKNPPPPPPPPPTPEPPVCLLSNVGGQVVLQWNGVAGARSYQVREDGIWRVRTTDLSWVGSAPHGVYTVEAVFKGNVKSDRAVCEGGGSN
ncbi:hypothetical protein JYT71_00065 [Acidimicrobiaceae bacterium AH-315-P05]|nr:hypothetical protein [Acidimicrobiaceae bacterium AH-315-P05]